MIDVDGIMGRMTLIFRPTPSGKYLVFGVLSDNPLPDRADTAVLVEYFGIVAENRKEEYSGRSYIEIIQAGIREL